MNLISIMLYTMMLTQGKTDNALLHGDIKFHLQLSMQTNDAKGIAAYIEETISFEYDNAIATKSKAQVEKAMQDFFSKNKCRSFKIDNQGTYKNLTRHMEGIFEAANNHRFQIYFEAVYDEKEAHHHLSKMVIEKISEN